MLKALTTWNTSPMVSINANTGLFFTPVDYEDNILQSARDRVYTLRGERDHRPNYGLTADYEALHAIPIALIQQAFASDSRLRVTSVEAFSPVLDVRGIAQPNPLSPVVLTLTTGQPFEDGTAGFNMMPALYLPGSWTASRATSADQIAFNEDSIDLHVNQEDLDIQADSTGYQSWYIYVKHNDLSWLIPFQDVPVLQSTSQYRWIKGPNRLQSLRQAIMQNQGYDWALAFVKVDNWITW